MTTSVSCNWIRARRSGPSSRWGWLCRPDEPDDVLRRLQDVQTMTVAELQGAAVVLGRHVRSGRMDVLVARVRVAFRLEQLGG